MIHYHQLTKNGRKNMIVNIKTMTLQGMEAQSVEVQVEVSNGFPRLGNSRASSY